MEAALADALPGWGLGGARLRLLCHSENTTWRADRDDAAPVVLRVHRAGNHEAAEIASERAWVAALHEAATVPTAAPLPLGGKETGVIAVDGRKRHVSAFAFLTGEAPAADARLPARFAALGELTARLHAQARAWTPPAFFRRRRWDFAAMLGPQPRWGDWRAAPGLRASDRAALEGASADLADRLARFGTSPARFGLIHADLRLANLLADGDRLAVIDFDDCGEGWFLYDFAAAVSFLEDSPALPALAEAWVAGYRRAGALPEAELAMLPSFVLLRRMLLLAWITSHAETETARAAAPGFLARTVALAARHLEDARAATAA